MKRLALLLALTACAHYPVNPPLAQADPRSGYRYDTVQLPRINNTFVVLAFSGGGSRAAGFSYGVLREMQNTKMPDGRTMLDYIDVISSVSGGSFTAMQFGLRGPQGLNALETRFLNQNVQSMLLRAVFLNPRNWWRLMSPNFHRIDIAQEIYDDVLFHDADFAEMLAAQKTGLPLIIANATELEIGSRFEWTQDQFDPICSDLSQVKVSRAVAASSAFPGLLTPMVINSYSGKCGYVTPPWVPNARRDEAVNPERTRVAGELEAILDPRRKFLHLMDGGIADNIGLRGPLHAVISGDAGFTIQGELNRAVIKHLLFIVVSAEPEASGVSIDATKRLPSLFQVIYGVINTPMSNYSFDTIALLRETFKAAKIRQTSGQPQVDYYYSVVNFPLVADAQLRARLNAIPTSFALKPGNLDDLKTAAAQVLRCSADYRKFVEALGGAVPPC